MNISDLTTKVSIPQRHLTAIISATLLVLMTSSAHADLDVNNTTTITSAKIEPFSIQPDLIQPTAKPKADTVLATDSPIISTNTVAKIERCDDSRQVVLSRYKKSQQRDIACMIDQLQPYQQANMTARKQYLAYKAQAWLTFANNKYSMNSRASIADYAYESGKEIFLALKNNDEQKINLVRDIPTASDLMRPDLWATLSALKDSGGIDSAPRELAYSEVSLIWAAADHCARGWRESSYHFRMADRWLEQSYEAYINANDSADSPVLIDLTNDYYEQYSPLDPRDDVCNGQVMPIDQVPEQINNTFALQTPVFISMPNPTATYTLAD